MGWWSRLASGAGSKDGLPQRTVTIGQRLLAATHDATGAGIQLTLKQQESVALLLREASHIGPIPPTGNVHAFFHWGWLNVMELGRAWFALAASAHGGVASAWADFWLLPAAEPGT